MKNILAIISLLFLSSCISREEVEAVIWLNNFNDESNSMAGVCERNPEIKQYGFYRKLNSGKLEFVSICNQTAINYLGVQKDDFNRLLDKALPKQQNQN